jgi:hypothetical protein
MEISYFYIFVLVPILVMTYLMQKPLREFERLYKQKIDPHAAFSPDEVNKEYGHRQLDFIKDTPKIIWRGYEILWKDYHDKEINKYAHKARLYFLGMNLVLIINFVVFAYFIYN